MEGKIYTWLLAIGAGFVTHLLGGWDMLLQAVIYIVALDILTGIGASLHEGRGLSSAIAHAGLQKKAMYVLLVIFGVVLDMLLVHNGIMQAPGLVRSATLYAVLVPEGLSIVENFGRAGVPLPKVIKQIMAIFQEKADAEI